MVEMDIQKELKNKVQEGARAYHAGHRQRLKERYTTQGVAALADHELLELLLTFSIPHRDTKPYAKKLLSVFQSLRRILEADLSTLGTLGELPAQSALHFKAMGDLVRKTQGEDFKRGRAITSLAPAARVQKNSQTETSKLKGVFCRTASL